jgi:hypothetical protein
MDPLWRREESVVQGKLVLPMFQAPVNNRNIENLAQWKNNGKSLVAQKLVEVVTDPTC